MFAPSLTQTPADSETRVEVSGDDALECLAVVPLANPKPEKVRFRVEIGRFGLARRVEIAPNVAPKSA
jgi:hypothetical protein